MEVDSQRVCLPRLNVISDKTLHEEWQNFRLDDREALEISIDLQKEVLRTIESPPNLIMVSTIPVETNTTSYNSPNKDIFWFFSFVMSLELTLKSYPTMTKTTIYLTSQAPTYMLLRIASYATSSDLSPKAIA